MLEQGSPSILEKVTAPECREQTLEVVSDSWLSEVTSQGERRSLCAYNHYGEAHNRFIGLSGALSSLWPVFGIFLIANDARGCRCELLSGLVWVGSLVVLMVKSPGLG